MQRDFTAIWHCHGIQSLDAVFYKKWPQIENKNLVFTINALRSSGADHLPNDWFYFICMRI